MYQYDFSTLPPETQLDIIRNMDSKTLTRLCSTSSQYRNICSGGYDYLWRDLVFELIDPIYVYRNIEEFNMNNNTKFNTWLEAYMYISKLQINGPTLIKESEKGHLEMVNYLVKKRVNIHVMYDAALRYASSRCDKKLVQYLVEHGANIHAKNDDALTSASENGCKDVIEYLISKGAYITNVCDTAFINALSRGHFAVAEYIATQCNVNPVSFIDVIQKASSEGNLEIVVFLGDLIKSPRILDEPLVLASAYGYLNIVKYLIQKGADVHYDNDAAYKEALNNGFNDISAYLEQFM